MTRRGESATGRLAGPADFMALRAERVSRLSVVGFRACGAHTESSTDVHPWHLSADRAAAVAIGQRVPGVHQQWRPADADTGCLWLFAPDQRSIGTIDTENGPPYEVEQTGDRQLVDEVLAAHQWWREQGEPPVSAWTVTVTRDGQTVQLDDQRRS